MKKINFYGKNGKKVKELKWSVSVDEFVSIADTEQYLDLMNVKPTTYGYTSNYDLAKDIFDSIR